MSFSIYILYPNQDDLVFDKDYYITKHVPLVEQIWGNFGLVSAEVVEFGPGADGSKPLYAYGCHLTWKDQPSFIAAVTQPDAKKLKEDVPNFSNHGSVQLAGPVIAKI